MCGIFGVVGGTTCNTSLVEIYKAFGCLARRSEKRGREAAGCAILYNNDITVYKRPISISKMLNMKSFKKFIENKNGFPIVLIGHTRLVTNGSQSEVDNNQPVVTSHCVGVHNGIVVNAEQIKNQYDLVQKSELDTEVLYRLIEQERSKTDSLQSALKNTFQAIIGSASIAFLTDQDDVIALATNTGSLYYTFSTELGIGIFASERFILEKVIVTTNLKAYQKNLQILQLEAQSGLLLNYRSLDSILFSLKPEINNTVNDCFSYSKIEIHYQPHSEQELLRCTNCLLPVTFPNIKFDNQGICNFCNTYHPAGLKGESELQALVEPYRSENGTPDCILAISGGRDSSYGLHYLKTVLGMNPITFTYDWGMVTDVARRNIAKLCGTLGIENIVRSPDISVKRRNIRLNIEAWLKKPELGMVPLFMAGDKQFYHIARQLRKETGINLVFFGAGNPLEKTEFKTGFCGIKESAHGSRLWDYSIQNKVDLLSYYGKNYLVNPSYLNRSVWDTFHAYFSTYIAKDDFVYLYHYIKWDERAIAEALEKNYEWETATDTRNTWRIGDGSAAFYNYIYYTVAGFSEYDTFRSNQIRAGIITRDEGLQLIKQDNQPRYDSMKQYALTIGLNLNEALTVINRMPKIYENIK